PTATPMPWGDIFRVVTELEDGFRHVAAHNMHAVDTELARRLRLVRPEIARLRRQRWWVEPRSGTVDDVADWVSWLFGESMRRICRGAGAAGAPSAGCHPATRGNARR